MSSKENNKWINADHSESIMIHWHALAAARPLVTYIDSKFWREKCHPPNQCKAWCACCSKAAASAETWRIEVSTCFKCAKMCCAMRLADWFIDRFRGISWYSAFYRFFPQGTLARVGKRKPPRFRENSKGSVNSLLTQCCSKFLLVHVSKLILSSCPWQLLFLPCLSDLLRASSVLRYSATSACPTCSATCKGVS